MSKPKITKVDFDTEEYDVSKVKKWSVATQSNSNSLEIDRIKNPPQSNSENTESQLEKIFKPVLAGSYDEDSVTTAKAQILQLINTAIQEARIGELKRISWNDKVSDETKDALFETYIEKRLKELTIK